MPLIDVEKIKKAGDYIRYLSLFGIENAQSGHPGLPTGCADIGAVLYRYVLRYIPSDPTWMNRDRFVLSAGHGSVLLYSLLHCSGYNYSLFDIANFRQLGSITPGHPEYDLTHGIETSTGPLGQGLANSVGLAVEQKRLAALFNKPGYPVFDYNIYAFMGDGCLMEGISYEAASIAGHLGLDNLIAIYDSNKTTIDGSTDITFTEDVRKRFEAQNWHVENADSENLEDYYRKLNDLKNLKGKPKLLIVKTTIGAGLDKMKGSNKIHGAPAGVDEVVYFIQNSRVKNLFAKACGEETVDNPEQLKNVCIKNIGEKILPVESPDVLAFMKEKLAENTKLHDGWKDLLEKYRKEYPAEHDALMKFMNPSVPENLKKKLLEYREQKADATRNISGRVLNLAAEILPQLVGGSADLAESTKAVINSSKYIVKNDFTGRNIAFGVREHAMGAIGNGLALGKAHLPFTSTFFTFFDYMKPAVRLASLMKIKQLFIFTHDSIYVGEDGPTHHPIEHLNALRLIPGLFTFRPANDMETAFSYLYYLDEMKGPAAVVCTRQKLGDELFRFESDRKESYDDFRKGAYLFRQTNPSTRPDVIIGASGSELGLALESAAMLEKNDGKNVRIVSIPCLELFEDSDPSYRDRLLCNGEVPFVFVEAASHRGVCTFYDRRMLLIQIQDFGVSGPPKKIAEKFGLTGDSVYRKIKSFL